MTDLMRWNPFDELRRIADEFERRIGAWSRPGSVELSPAVGTGRWDDRQRLRIPLPGVAPEDIQVEVAGRALHIRATEKDGDEVVASYNEVLTLPDTIDTDRITASVRHGVLELMLPYKEAVKPRRIEIQAAERQQLPAAA